MSECVDALQSLRAEKAKGNSDIAEFGDATLLRAYDLTLQMCSVNDDGG